MASTRPRNCELAWRLSTGPKANSAFALGSESYSPDWRTVMIQYV